MATSDGPWGYHVLLLSPTITYRVQFSLADRLLCSLLNILIKVMPVNLCIGVSLGYMRGIMPAFQEEPCLPID